MAGQAPAMTGGAGGIVRDRRLALARLVVLAAFAAWVASLGPLPLDAGASRSRPPCVDRNGKLLRAYAMADGRWRLPVDAKSGVDPALSRNCCWPMRTSASTRIAASIRWRSAAPRCSSSRSGRIVSGGSTITMQVARLLEPRRERSLYAKLRQMVRAVADRAAAEQGRDPRSVSDAGAVRRQSRRHPRRLARLFRQGAEAAVAGGSRAAGRAAAIAGDAAGSIAIPTRRTPRATACSTRMVEDGVVSADDAAQAKAVPVPRLRKPMPMLAPHSADQAIATVKDKPTIRLTLDAGMQRALEALARDRAAALGPEHLGRHPRGRQ